MTSRLERLSMLGFRVILVSAAIGIGLSGVTLNAQAATPPSHPGQQRDSSQGVKTADQVYKNLHVLKNIPADDIHPAMEYITMALGVRCNYCHVNGKFDSDDKRTKRTARKMMTMMFALDGTVFNGHRSVSCFTCHRGSPIPTPTQVFPGDRIPKEASAREIAPSIAVSGLALDSSLGIESADADKAPTSATATKEQPNQPPLPTAEEVLAKYIQALGGPDAVRKATTLAEKGTVEMPIPAPAPPDGLAGEPHVGQMIAELYRKAPNRGVTVIQTPAGPYAEGFDGTMAWLQLPNRNDEVTGGEMALLRRDSEFIPATHASEDYSHLQVDAIEKIGDHDTYRLIGQREQGIDRFYFDTQSGLLIRSWTTMDSVLGSFPEETTYEDYRNVSGIKMPFTIHLVSPEGNRTYKWDQIEIDAAVDDARFARPPQKPQPAPAASSNDHGK